jgi:hypothetical protein
MNLLTHNEFLTLSKQFPYYDSKSTTWSRWDYMSLVIDEIKLLKPSTICEVGTEGISLCKESFILDHNLDNVPYPVKDKQFDLFIALQVWEHLHNQSKAFDEVMRISHNAILSFPYLWNTDKENCHYMITKDKISEWTLGTKPEKVIPVKNRLVYVWRF